MELKRNWLIGYRIAEEELKGNGRVYYGVEIIKKLSKKLTEEYGKEFHNRNLYYFLKFYNTYPKILNSVSSKSKALLTWTHYRILLQFFDSKAREWYEKKLKNGLHGKTVLFYYIKVIHLCFFYSKTFFLQS